MTPETNPARQLTLKQQAFAHAYVETSNASEAYRRTYNASNMSANAIRVEACRLLKRPNVALMVQELRYKAMERAELSIESVLAALIEDRALARRLGNPTAAIKADIYLGKHIGMWPARIEATVDYQHTHALDGASREELRLILAKLRAERKALEQGTVIEGEATVVG